jgi:hypothetical protein
LSSTAASLGNICFPRQYGLSHPRHIAPSDVAACIDLHVREYPLPGVACLLESGLLLIKSCLRLLVLHFPLFNLLLSFSLPLLDLLGALLLPLLLLKLVLLRLLIESSHPILLLLLNSGYSLPLLKIQFIIIFSDHDCVSLEGSLHRLESSTELLLGAAIFHAEYIIILNIILLLLPDHA